MNSPVRGCSMEEVESERADRLREDANGGVPFPPCLNCRFSAYITCTQTTAISSDFLVASSSSPHIHLPHDPLTLYARSHHKV